MVEEKNLCKDVKTELSGGTDSSEGREFYKGNRFFEKKNPPEVLCIGQAVIDCITRGQEADKHRENVFRAERIELHIGGDAVNESVALTDLGHHAAIACGVGTDLAGNLLREELARRGVDTSNISVQKTLSTPIAQLVVHQDGGRHSINSRATMLEGYVPFGISRMSSGDSGNPPGGSENPSGDSGILSGGSVNPSADSGISNSGIFKEGQEEQLPAEQNAVGPVPSEEAMRAAMAGVRIVSFASLFRAPLDRAEVIRSLVLAAKEAGAIVSADTKLPTFREVPVEALSDVWPLIDYIFPNEKEAAYYTGETDCAAMAAAFRRLGVRNAVIKAGPEGCYVDGESGAFHLPALPVEVVDSTGAGDNFVAGFLSGVLQGEDLRACAERGRARASQCISRMGA